MRRCVLLCLTLTLVSACRGDDATRPALDPASSPSGLISDGSHNAGNPDFFFLPPLVRDPKTLPGGAPNPLWNAGGANARLTPSVRICQLDVTATSGGTVTAPVTDATSCKTGAYDVTTMLTAANVSRGILDDADIDAALASFLTHYSSFVEPYYHFGWKVPAGAIGTTTPPAFYRIAVSVGKSKTLGVLDVESVNNFAQLFNVKTQEFVPLTGGVRVPINFRIEQYALCDVPGTPTCTSASGDISVTPLTVQTGTPDPSGISTATGITIPVQTQFTSSTPVTVTLSTCPSLNPRVLDLPTFGNCARVTTDPVLPKLSDPATIFVCSVGINAPGLFTGLTETQEARVTLHQYDADGPNKGLRALPHAQACTQGYPGGIATIEPSVGAMLANLVHGRFKQAATAALALMAPKPLYAAMFIDLGGGGFTVDCCSDFQFALPAKMEIVPGTNNQTVPPGSSVAPAVKVTDLGGDPVQGARVTFAVASGGGSVAPASVVSVTGPDGIATASATWTLGSSPGINTLTASGQGIASPTTHGPRAAFDPFQPIQSHFDPSFTGTPVAVPVLTGSVSFSALGERPREIAIYKNYNAWFGENKDETVLQSTPFNFVRGTDYLVRPMSGLQAGIPATTTIIVVTSASQGDQNSQVTQERAGAANLDAWVRNGGLLILHAGYNGGTGYIVPGLSGGVDAVLNCAGLTLAVADHPFIRGPDGVLGTADDLTNDNIDIAPRSCYDNHGSLNGLLPDGSQVLMVEQVSGRPVYATYALGKGRVIVTTLTMEYGPQSTQTLINHFYWAINGTRAPTAVVAARTPLMTPSLGPTRSVAPTDSVTRNSDGSPRP